MIVRNKTVDDQVLKLKDKEIRFAPYQHKIVDKVKKVDLGKNLEEVKAKDSYLKVTKTKKKK